MARLQGKVAVVTGAALGMGFAISQRFAEEGAKVIMGDINEEKLHEAVKKIQDAGGDVTGLVANVTKQVDVDKMLEAAVKHYGKLDVLVNNAGIMDNFKTAESLDDKLYDLVMDVNVRGPMMLIRGAIPLMKKAGKGAILNIASVAGLNGSRGGYIYTASKHALVGMTKNIGYVYATEGIRCNAIAPGGVATSIGESETMKSPDEFGMGRAGLGFGLNPRYGEAVEIANAAVFLCSDEASFVSGDVLVVDGGWTAY